MFLKIIYTLFIAFFSLCSQAQVSQLEALGQTPGGAGFHVNYDSSGQRLFVGCGSSIWVCDVSDTSNYHVIAKRPLLGIVNETDLYADILFAAATHDGLYALDANAASLDIIHHYPVYGDSAAYDIWRSNDTIYLSDGKRVKMLRYDELNGFTLLRQFGNPNAFCAAQRGSYVAVGCRGIPKGSISVYHVNDLENPVATWKSEMIWRHEDIRFADLRDDIIYVCGGPANLLFSKSYFVALQFTGDSLFMVDSISYPGVIGLAQANIINMDSRNDTLFLATTAALNNQLETIVPVLDASGLPDDSLEDIAHIRPGLWHFDVALMHGTPYLATSSEWFGVLFSDVSELQPTDTLGFLETGGWTDKGKLSGDTLWACHRGYGLAAYLTDSLYYTSGYMTDSKILHIFTQFVSDFDFLNDSLIILNTAEIYNLAPWHEGSKPEFVTKLNLGFINTVNFMETDMGPRIVGGFSHILPMPTALVLADPYDSLNPNPVIDSVQIKNNVLGVAVSGDTVYSGYKLGNQNYLAVFKVTNDEFVLIDTITSHGEIRSISVAGDRIMVSCGTLWLAWYGFKNGKLAEKGSYFDWNLNAPDVYLKNEYVYVAEKFYGLRIYEFKDTSQIELVAECRGTGGWNNLFGSAAVDVGKDGLIYLSDFHAGVIIIEPIDISIAAEQDKFQESTETLIVYPNPAKDFFHINLPSGNNERIKELHMINPNGKIMLIKRNVDSSDAMINITGLQSGLYMLKVLGTKNNVYQRKVIVY